MKTEVKPEAMSKIAPSARCGLQSESKAESQSEPRKLTLNVLVCCYADSVYEVPALLLPQRDDVRYFISHQHPEGWDKDVPDILLDREDVYLSSFVGRGISQNRNHALEMLISIIGRRNGTLPLEVIGGSDDTFGEICLVADDDVKYTEESFDTVLNAYRQYSQADMIFFKIAASDGDRPFKDYSDRPRWITKPVLSGKGYLSSIEMSFRFAPVFQNGIVFDEDFGIGSAAHPEGGEETVFLHDCLCSGMKALYLPEFIVSHPFESTGKAGKTVAKADMMLAVCQRTVGTFSFETFKAALRCIYRRLCRLCQ